MYITFPSFRYHEGRVYVIDVSQSVEHDHPHALEFLRKDCTNITDFFKKNGVCTMTVKELFDFVVDNSITCDNIEVCFHTRRGNGWRFVKLCLFFRSIWIKWLH